MSSARRQRILAASLAVLAAGLLSAHLLGERDPTATGRDAYADEQWDAALAAFTAAEARASLRATTDLLEARSLAALKALALRDAEASAEKLFVRGGKPAAGRRAFLLGVSAYTRALRAGAEADLPGGDPTALDRGVDHARRALLNLQEATRLGRDGTGETAWPIALRNAERAAILLDQLRAKRDLRDQQQQQQPPPPKEQELQIPQIKQDDDDSNDARDAADKASLQQLLERLAAREQEKRDLRDALRDRRSRDVEADW